MRRQLGAFVNETFQARGEGLLAPDVFPDSVSTYLGHYHKPHTVGATRVQYVGSPYEGAAHRPACFSMPCASVPTLLPLMICTWRLVKQRTFTPVHDPYSLSGVAAC